jgi:hypothetical protein
MFQFLAYAAVASTSLAPLVRVHGANVPVNWLVREHDPRKYPTSVLSTPEKIRQANRSIHWTKSREQLIAGAAAGVHLTLFSFNLAFWGFEGMPRDRYNPSNIRCGWYKPITDLSTMSCIKFIGVTHTLAQCMSLICYKKFHSCFTMVLQAQAWYKTLPLWKYGRDKANILRQSS